MRTTATIPECLAILNSATVPSTTATSKQKRSPHSLSLDSATPPPATPSQIPPSTPPQPQSPSETKKQSLLSATYSGSTWSAPPAEHGHNSKARQFRTTIEPCASRRTHL